MSNVVIAKYIRLSIEDAKTDSMSIENQRLFLDSHIADLELDAEVIELVDNGYSGTNFERPAVQELLELVQTGRVNCIVVKDFSRFGRNAIETGYYIEKVFPIYGIRFIAVSDNYDSADHVGDTGGLEVAFKFLIHEQYSRDLSKKIKSAAQERMRRGERISKNCAFGYVKTADNRLQIDENAADTVRLIFNLYVEGKSLALIAAELYQSKTPTPSLHKNQTRKVKSDEGFDYVWGKSVLLAILRDEQYIGTYVAGKSVTLDVGSGKQKRKPESEWIRIPDHHPTIISPELFDKVQTMLNTKGEPLRKRQLGTSQRYARSSPLKGKVFCASCGHTMTQSNTKNTAFHCRFTIAAPDAPCHHLRKLDEELCREVFRAIRKLADKKITGTLSSRGFGQQAERQISDCEAEKRVLYERLVSGEIDTDEYRAKKDVVDTRLDALSIENEGRHGAEQSAAAFRSNEDLRKLAKGADSVLTRPVVDLLVGKVLVFPDGKTEIVWKQ